MSTFCLLAYIPCIIIIVWLIIEIRKFIIVRRRFQHTEYIWNKINEQREKRRDRDSFVETIPTYPSRPLPDYSYERSDDYYSTEPEDIDYSRKYSTKRKPHKYHDFEHYEDRNLNHYEDEYFNRRRRKTSRKQRPGPTKEHRRSGRNFPQKRFRHDEENDIVDWD